MRLSDQEGVSSVHAAASAGASDLLQVYTSIFSNSPVYIRHSAASASIYTSGVCIYESSVHAAASAGALDLFQVPPLPIEEGTTQNVCLKAKARIWP